MCTWVCVCVCAIVTCAYAICSLVHVCMGYMHAHIHAYGCAHLRLCVHAHACWYMGLQYTHMHMCAVWMYVTAFVCMHVCLHVSDLSLSLSAQLCGPVRVWGSPGL